MRSASLLLSSVCVNVCLAVSSVVFRIRVLRCGKQVNCAPGGTRMYVFGTQRSAREFMKSFQARPMTMSGDDAARIAKCTSEKRERRSGLAYSSSRERIRTSVRCSRDGKAPQRGGRRRHAIEQQRAEPRTGRREIQHLHPAVVGRRAAAHQAARLEPVHQPGDVRGVAGERLGELSHRDRPARLDQVQHMALRRRQLELGGQRRQVRALGEKELDQQLPGIAGVGLVGFIRRQYSSFDSIVDIIKY